MKQKQYYWIPVGKHQREEVGITTTKWAIYLFEEKKDAEDYYGVDVVRVEIKAALKKKN